MYKYTLNLTGSYIQVRDQLLAVAKASFNLETTEDGKYVATCPEQDAFPASMVVSVEEVQEEVVEEQAEQA